MMLMMETEGKVDVFNFVLDMRHKRNYMVQTEVRLVTINSFIITIHMYVGTVHVCTRLIS